MKKNAVLLLSADTHLVHYWQGLSTDYALHTAIDIPQAQQWLELHPTGIIMADAALVDAEQTTWQQLMNHAVVVVGSLNPNDAEGQRYIVIGAKGYFHAYSPIKQLDKLLTQVGNGHIWIGQSLLNRLLSQLSNQLLSSPTPVPDTGWQQLLTPREIDVALRAALGHSNALIADDLHISERTVRAHLSAVFEKLHVKDRLQLTLKVHGITADTPL